MGKLVKKPENPAALGTQPIPRLVLRFAGATFVALVLNSIYTLTDTLFVSWGVGDNAMGGVSIVFPFVVLQGAISTAVGSGAASLVSRKLGAGKPEAAGEVTCNAMFVFYSTAIVITVLGLICMDPLLGWMGVTPELSAYARAYFFILLAGNVFSTGFSNIMRAEGKMRYAMLIWVIPISINIALDAVFILALGWGVKGSALATVLSQFISFSMSVLFFLKFTSQRFRGAKIRIRRIGEILAIGLPSLVQMGSLSAATVLLNQLLGSVGGTLGINTFAYISKVVTFGIVPFTAVAQALAPVVGYNFGNGNRTRVKHAVSFSLLVSCGYAAVAFLVIEAVPGSLIGLFTGNAELIAQGAAGLRVVGLALLFMPLPMLAGAACQAMGKKLWALLMYASNMVFLIPVALLLARFWGMQGVWWAYVLANLLSCVIAAAYLFWLQKGKKRGRAKQKRRKTNADMVK